MGTSRNGASGCEYVCEKLLAFTRATHSTGQSHQGFVVAAGVAGRGSMPEETVLGEFIRVLVRVFEFLVNLTIDLVCAVSSAFASISVCAEPSGSHLVSIG